MRLLIASATVAALYVPARADRTDGERAAHLGAMVVFGGAYLAMEIPFRDHFAARACRWCDAPGVDRGIRDRLVWQRTQRVALAGDIVGFAVSPLTLSSLMIAASGSQRSWRRTFDDLAPMVESAIVVSLMQSAFKYTVRRRRPFVGTARPGRAPHHDDHHSFWSGHVSAVFAETVACGVVASARGYRMAPALWATGLTLGVVTGYLRIAADKHYASDVVLGAVLGSAIGLAVPHVLHRSSLEADPTATARAADSVPRFVSIGGAF